VPRIQLAFSVCAATALAACGSGEKVSGPPPPAPTGIRLTSVAFKAGAMLPGVFSCDGRGSSPPLAWSAPPKNTRELALLVEDPDAPGGTFVHWTLYSIPPSTRSIPAGGAPPGSRQGDNSFGRSGYGAPCPPKGSSPHRYVFTLYALSRSLGLADRAAPKRVRSAIAGAALARGTLTTSYGR
jgi:Raf kinase inhibitor-like YbhB/YbcL family protein